MRRYILKELNPESLSLFTQYKKGKSLNEAFLDRLRKAYRIVLVQYSEVNPCIKIGRSSDYIMTFHLHDGYWYGIRELDNRIYNFSESTLNLWFVPLNDSKDYKESVNFVSRIVGLLKLRNLFRIRNQ